MTNLPLTEHSAEDPELDVRPIPHKIRHGAVHGVVDALAPGASFVLLAPHNPLPLLSEIAAKHGDAVSVTYLDETPKAWRLRITRE
ncbi:MAG TPA: DUF2249 domain-containing protein [Candidatus Avipropionibacterium avicola]|uniref:DUF2249 domain-containing protein n=1 Tax=Candidatus Avipropionibacterium avicola TaxID=2840701 RepID=A0A9D1GYP5_9ACTN|nr:DUF2249 domain-containing protein [Candidatus Avipropionibacterium avicola]